MTPYDVAIVGAGFCGTMVAVNLARATPHLSVALVERGPAPAQGLAYGTTDPGHLLNVRAGQMGGFADRPDHFIRWLRANPEAHPGSSERDFVPRMVYGRYLGALLDENRERVRHLCHFVTDIEPLPGGGFELRDAEGKKLAARRVVLALGNFPPEQSAGMGPYDPATWATIADDGDVLIIGSGLTSLDLVVTLAKTKKTGAIHLLSRHGLLPRVHVEPQAYTLKLKPPFPATARGLCAALRREIAETDLPWQSVIDALRPHNQSLWQGMGLQEQRRFLRHLRAFWDVHRHRCAPEVMAAYDALEKAGRLKLHHGSIVSQTRNAQDWSVDWRPRGKHKPEQLKIRHIVRATGPQADFTKLDDALVQNLLRRKLIAPDALRLGLAADGFSPLDAEGRKTPGLFALGSLLKGALYESVAVPELRQQAATVAAIIDKEAAPL